MTEPERWLPVVGYEGLYEVSDLGRVRSVDRFMENIGAFGVTRRFYPGRLRTTRASNQGRVEVYLWVNGRKDHKLVQHLVLTAFVGPRPDGMDCCHNDGDSLNNRLDNLRWDSRSANIRDTVRHGTHRNARKTHCKYGHPYSGDNLIVWAHKPNSRACRTCQAAASRRFRARQVEQMRREAAT